MLIFTDSDGKHEYVHCLQSGDGHLFCFSSYLPWFECFRKILEEIRTREVIRRDKLPALKNFLEQLRVLSPPPITKHFLTLTPTSTLFPGGHRVPIPSMVNPCYGRCFEYYYAALDTLQWVDIFVSCLLEKNILFCSRSRERLTLCIIAAITLLHPLSWVLPIYLLLTKKLLEVLQSPVPFIAGIHTCMLEDAKQFISYGTRIVDLDQRKILVNAPEEDLDAENIPCHIIDFLEAGMDSSKKALKSAMNSKSDEFASWKTSSLELQNFIMQRTEPFFALLVNLLGFYRKCIDEEGHVDFKKMIKCQACPSLEPFLERLFQSQMVHCFLEDRIKEHHLDPFETRCRSLTDSCLARCPPEAINFGDAIWLTCKRNATNGGLRRYNRMRQKISRHMFKNSLKGRVRYERESKLITLDSTKSDSASLMGRSTSFTTGQVDKLDSVAVTHRQGSLMRQQPRPKSTLSLVPEQPGSSTTTSHNGVGVAAPVSNNNSSLPTSSQIRTLPPGSRPPPPLPPRPLRPPRPPRPPEMANMPSPSRTPPAVAKPVESTMSVSTTGLQRTNFTGNSPADTLLCEIQKKLAPMGSFRKSVSASNLVVANTSSSENSIFQDVLDSEHPVPPYIYDDRLHFA